MSDETIFGGGNGGSDQGQQQPPQNAQAPQLPDSVAALVGEGKKYASVDAALASLPHAQEHISKLETELAELRQKVAGSQSAEEVLRAIEELKKAQSTPAGAAFNPDDLAGLVAPLLDKQLAAREAQSRAKSNAAEVTKALSAKYGEKAEEQYKAKANELGISVARLNELASESPKAVLAYFGTQAVQSPASSQGSVNAAAFSQVSQPQQVKSVMSGASTSEMVSAWRAAGN